MIRADLLPPYLSDWIRDYHVLLGWLAGVSVFTLIAAAIAAPIIVSRMRADYFMPDRDPDRALARRHPVLRWSGLILKNLLGIVLFIAGFLMLFMPGQGLLTIFIGIILTDFPGKRKLELRLVQIPAMHKGIDWIRKKNGKRPLELPDRKKSLSAGRSETERSQGRQK